jgi:hypothetical protein
MPHAVGGVENGRPRRHSLFAVSEPEKVNPPLEEDDSEVPK